VAVFLKAAVGHWKKRLRDEGGRMKGEIGRKG
jgi:hypothetical protein